MSQDKGIYRTKSTMTNAPLRQAKNKTANWQGKIPKSVEYHEQDYDKTEKCQPAYKPGSVVMTQKPCR